MHSARRDHTKRAARGRLDDGVAQYLGRGYQYLPSNTFGAALLSMPTTKVRGTMMQMADPQDHIVFVVDDDRRIREALAELISSFGMHAVTCGSAAEYLAYPNPGVPACLVLDVQLPDINGLDLQSQFAQGSYPPIVFITGHGDIPSRTSDQGGRGRLSDQAIRGKRDLMRASDQCCPRAKSREPAEASTTRRSPTTSLVSDSTRAGSAATDRERSPQQTGRGRSWHQRGHAPDSSWQGHEEDGRRIACRARLNGRCA